MTALNVGRRGSLDEDVAVLLRLTRRHEYAQEKSCCEKDGISKSQRAVPLLATSLSDYDHHRLNKAVGGIPEGRAAPGCRLSMNNPPLRVTGAISGFMLVVLIRITISAKELSRALTQLAISISAGRFKPVSSMPDRRLSMIAKLST